jgi:hypothetical protein
MPPKDAEKSKKTSGFLTPVMVEGIAAVSSLMAGGVMAWREILAESYANFTDMKLVDHIKDKHRRDFGPELAKKIESRAISTEVATQSILKNNTHYHEDVAAFFKEAGFDKFSNRMQLLNSHERWKIGLSAAAVASVTLGSVLLLGRNLFVEKADNNQVSSLVVNDPDLPAAKQLSDALSSGTCQQH